VGGFVVLLALESYPAVLIFYAYGLGMLKAKRFEDLFRLFSSDFVASNNRNPSSVVQNLLLGWWKGGQDENVWKIFPGFEQRKTPLSDHLLEILGPWTKDYLYGPNEFTTLFEEFELLAAIAFLMLTTDLETLQKHSQTSDIWNFVPAPTGRIAWDSANRDAVLKSFANPEKLKLVLAAGFAKSDHAFWYEAIANLQRIFARVSWR
jgi:hypothetical protein